jgi:glycosyltransferase involved in cell wall biosynthesis
MERVSVVIPTRNRAGLVELAVEMTLRQEGVEVEVIVVDDGSDDDTSERLRALGDPRVTVLRHDVSCGIGAARNTGVAHASSAWVAFRDDDDVWAPTKLAQQVSAANETGATWIYCGYVPVNPALAVIGESWHPTDPAKILDELRRTCSIACGSIVLARRDAIVALGGFDSEIGIGIAADWDMWLRLAASEPAATTPGILVGYVRQPGSVQLQNVDSLGAEFDFLKKKHAAVGLDLDETAFLAWIPGMYRQAGQRRRAAQLYARSAWRLRRPTDLARAGAALGSDGLWERIRALRGKAFRPGVDGHDPDWLQVLRGEVAERMSNVVG